MCESNIEDSISTDKTIPVTQPIPNLIKKNKAFFLSYLLSFDINEFNEPIKSS